MDYTKIKVYKKNIVIYYSKNGDILRYYTGIHLKDLDKKKYDQSVKMINDGSLPKHLQRHRNHILSQKQLVENKINELIDESDDNEEPSPREVRHRIEKPKLTKNTLFLVSLNQFIKEKETTFRERNTLSSLKDFVSFRNGIEDYEKHFKVKLKVKDINRDFLLSYKSFLLENRPLGMGFKTKGGLNGRTIKKRFDVVRYFFKWMLGHHLFMYDNIISILNTKDFDLKRITPPVKKFSLTSTQVEMISDMRLTEGTPLCKVRDMFLLTCKLGIRFSDLITIKKRDIQNNINGVKVLKRKSVKTSGKEYSIEIPDSVLSILEKYDYRMNLMTNQKSNYYLKELLKSHEEFQKESDQYFKDEDDRIPYKYWELITFHTGRRSFITILLNEMGFSTVEVMKRTDHTKISTLEQYVIPSESKEKSVRNVFK